MDVHCTTEERGQTKIGWLLMLGVGVAISGLFYGRHK